MKKKFKSILLFSSILGVTAITAGAIALTSCGNVDKPIDNTTPSKPITPNIPNDNLDSGNSTQKPSTPIIPNPNPNTPGSDSGISGGNNQDSSNNEGQEKPPGTLVLTEAQRAIIKNSPTLSWLFDTTGGARFILNNQNLNDENSINSDINDSNVKDLMTLCGLKENIDPFKANAYFPNALIFEQAANKTNNFVNITTDPTLGSNISFYLFDKDAINPLLDTNWVQLGGKQSKNIELLSNTNLYLAIKFSDDITQYGYDVPQLVSENIDNSISKQYIFENLPHVGNIINGNQQNETITNDFNKKIFFYRLNKPSTQESVNNFSIETPNKVELILKKKEKEQNNASNGWKTIDTLVEGEINPRATKGVEKIGVNDIIKAYTYSVLDKDTISYPNYSTIYETSTSEKWFKINDKTINQFGTTYSDLSQLEGKRKVNLYVLYTNGNNIDLNQLVVKAGCKLLLINNNPNKTSKIICSNDFLEYGKGHTDGLQFDLGSSFGWYGKFDFTVLTKGKSIIGSNIKNFIFSYRNKVNYTLPTTSKLLTSFEPNNKFKDL